MTSLGNSQTKEPPPAATDSPASQMRRQYVDRRLNALEAVLTPDQLKEYTQMLEKKMEMITAMLPGQKP